MRFPSVAVPHTVRWAGRPACIIAVLFLFVVFLLGYKVHFAFLMGLVFWVLVLSGVALFRDIPPDRLNLFFLVVGFVAALAVAAVSEEGGMLEALKRPQKSAARLSSATAMRAQQPSPATSASTAQEARAENRMNRNFGNRLQADVPLAGRSVPTDSVISQFGLNSRIDLLSTAKSDSVEIPVGSLRQEVERAITRGRFFAKQKRYHEALTAIDGGVQVLARYRGNTEVENLFQDLTTVAEAIRLNCLDQRRAGYDYGGC